MPIAKAFDFGTDLYESATNEADADAENTSGDMHAQEADETQPSAESDNIQYPSMLGRMVELESVVATVRSSLDNHTSSYYSVASQIAE
ncbi:hypothetical protein LPJ59_006726 [Coemansia sp. RSA 2399]|nr:hypothetical protein LPJ59_006726 [Coemansia sp. RSA 2399]KAJ1886558.1 hypothetical protein LPJ81_006681 [Coemansia sp. IMI 209127]